MAGSTRRATNGSSGQRAGLWLVGACGGVGATVALGLAALRRRLTSPIGMVSALREFESLNLVAVSEIVLGGHEIRQESLIEAVESLHRKSRVFEPPLIEQCTRELRAINRDIRPGTAYACEPAIRRMADRHGLARGVSPLRIVDRLAGDIQKFRERHHLTTAVVVDVSSSEPPVRRHRAHSSWGRLRAELGRRGSSVLPSSSLYALAAIECGCPFINFTPSTGIRVEALRERAEEIRVCYMGADGKTGETLVKSALAPMFATRHLDVRSWFGQNILGNRDGAVLRDPRTRAGKLKTKDRTVRAVVGGNPVTQVGIDFVESLGDWKVAWDFIHFRGFLDTMMHMQFVWHGCDSALAAPLVIDLMRFAEWEQRRGGAGPMRHLAFFFKDPIDVDSLDLAGQWDALRCHFGVGG